MKVVRLTQELPCSAEAAWDAFCNPAHLRAICYPIVTFGKKSVLPKRWESGAQGVLHLSLLGVIPWSQHTVSIESSDKTRWTLITRESGGAIRTWKHQFQITPLETGSCRCIDVVEIDAGPLTFLVWAYAQLLYRHRYARWRKLIHSGSAQIV